MATNLELLCLVLFACIANVSVGLVIVRTGKYTWAIRLSLAILVLACGVLDLLDTQSGRGTIVGLMIVTGIGSGGIINSEIVTAQASVAIEQYVILDIFKRKCVSNARNFVCLVCLPSSH